MMARARIRSWILPLMGISMVALTSACGPTVVKEKAKMEDAVSYKTVDDGTLNVVVSGQPFSSEQYTIEKGSDGHWIASAQVQPAQAGQNTRDVRMELNSDYAPISYSDDGTGGTKPVKVYISFTADKSVATVKAGDDPEGKKEIPGKVDLVYLGDGVFSHAAILARAYAQKNSTEPAEFNLFGGVKLTVKELEPGSYDKGGAPVAVRHFLLDIGGQSRIHVWLNKEDLKLAKIESGRSMNATKADLPEAAALTAFGPKPEPAAAASGDASSATAAATPAPAAAPTPAPAAPKKK